MYLGDDEKEQRVIDLLVISSEVSNWRNRTPVCSHKRKNNRSTNIGVREQMKRYLLEYGVHVWWISNAVSLQTEMAIKNPPFLPQTSGFLGSAHAAQGSQHPQSQALFSTCPLPHRLQTPFLSQGVGWGCGMGGKRAWEWEWCWERVLDTRLPAGLPRFQDSSFPAAILSDWCCWCCWNSGFTRPGIARDTFLMCQWNRRSNQHFLTYLPGPFAVVQWSFVFTLWLVIRWLLYCVFVRCCGVFCFVVGVSVELQPFVSSNDDWCDSALPICLSNSSLIRFISLTLYATCSKATHQQLSNSAELSSLKMRGTHCPKSKEQKHGLHTEGRATLYIII